MTSYLKIENGIVANRIIVEIPTDFPEWTLIPDREQVDIGDLWDGNNFTKKSIVPEIPAQVSRRQAKKALFLAGKLNLVQPAIDAIPDAAQRELMQIEWDESLDFERTNPSLISMATALGMTSDDLDQLFIVASKL